MKKRFIRLQIERMEGKESTYFNSGKMIRARLTAVMSNLLVSIIPSFVLTLVIYLSKVVLLIKNNGFYNIFSSLKWQYFILPLVTYISIYVCVFLIFCIPIATGYYYPHIKSLLKFDEVLNFWSKEQKVHRFYIKLLIGIIVLVIVLFSVIIPIALTWSVFASSSNKINAGSFVDISLCVITSILLFSSIYLLPENNDKQKFQKNHAKFFLWLIALVLSIYTIFVRFEGSKQTSSLEILFFAISILISIERMYKSYKELEKIYYRNRLP